MTNVQNGHLLRTCRVFEAAMWMIAALILCMAGATAASAQEAAEPRFRLGILGLTHGHAFIEFRTLAKKTVVEVVAISDPDPALRAQAAAIWPGVKIYDNHRQLLDEMKPEGVWSFAANDEHLAITREVAKRGISVMFDKPMATNYADAVKMRDLVKASGIQMVINSQPPWLPAHHTARQVAQSGQIGKVWRVRTVSGLIGPDPEKMPFWNPQFWSMMNSPAAGALLDMGPYGAAWVRQHLGMPTTVNAVRSRSRQDIYKVPTTYMITASYPDNRLGLIEASWDLPRNMQQVEVFGDKGSVDLVSNPGNQLIRFEVWEGTEKREVPIATLEPQWSNAPTYFVNAVRQRKVDEFVSADFHVDVMAILEAAKRSADTGKPVSIASVVGR